MVSKIKTLPQQDKEGALEKEDREIVADSPLAGLSDAAVQLIRSAKKRGYVTHDQINSVLPWRRSIPSRSRMSSPCSVGWVST